MHAKFAMNRRTLAKASLASVAALKVPGTLLAQDASPVPDGPPPGPPMEVLLTGLHDPRFLVVDGGDVYFTESGTGGDEEIFTIPGEGTPEPTAPISMSGHTGKLSKMSVADGSVTEIVSDFRSYTFGENGEIVGPAGLALDGAGSAFVTVGAPGPFVGMMPLTGEEGVVYKVDLASGSKEVVADLIDWEINQNPDPVAVDSNLYGADYLDGVVYVADAGGNSIISVNADDGTVATFAVTGGLPAEFLPESGNPNRGGAREIDSVPSRVKVGPDGRLYVSFVTGGPFPPGIAPIQAYALDGTMEVYAEGLSMTADIAFDSQGRLYASIISTDFLNQAPGQVVRVEADGSLTPVVPMLPIPAGIAFDADDNLYALIFSAVAPDGGQLVRITGVADVPAGSGTPEATPVAGGDVGTVVTLIDGEIQPAELSIAANTDATISVTNSGTIGHNFTVEGTDFATATIDAGTAEDLVVNLPAGTYTYFCSVPGHREAGMVGTLTVA